MDNKSQRTQEKQEEKWTYVFILYFLFLTENTHYAASGHSTAEMRHDNLFSEFLALCFLLHVTFSSLSLLFPVRIRETKVSIFIFSTHKPSSCSTTNQQRIPKRLINIPLSRILHKLIHRLSAAFEYVSVSVYVCVCASVCVRACVLVCVCGLVFECLQSCDVAFWSGNTLLS